MNEETKIKIQLARIIQDKMSASYKRIVEFHLDDIQVIDWLISQTEKVEQLQQENEMFKAALDESAKASATMQKKIGRYAKVIEEILYHYPTPIDEELDYEKAYNEVKEIAKRAWEGIE